MQAAIYRPFLEMPALDAFKNKKHVAFFDGLCYLNNKVGVMFSDVRS